MAEKLTPEQFAAEIIKRRPDLANIPMATLVGKTLQGAPELKEFVNLDLTMPEKPGAFGSLFSHLGVQREDPGLHTKPSPFGMPISVDLTKPSVTSEGAAQVTKGVGLGVKNAPAGVKDFVSSMLQYSSPAKTAEFLGNAYQGAKSLVAPIVNMDNPESPSWQAAQQGSGALLSQSALPNAVGGVLKAGAVGARSMIPETLPARLYESALKPGPRSNTRPEINRMIATALREGIPVTARGGAKLDAVVDALNAEISGRISSASNKGVTVSPVSVASRVRDIIPKFANQVNPRGDMAEIGSSTKQFMREHTTKAIPAGPATTNPHTGVRTAGSRAVPAREIPIPAEKAQAIKQGTYRALKSKSYGELKGASVETQKQLARGLKEELAAKIPEIQKLNLSESDLLQLKPELDAAINRIANREIIGIGTPIATGAVAGATGSPTAGVLAGIVRSLLDRPGLKSRLAIALENAKRP